MISPAFVGAVCDREPSQYSRSQTVPTEINSEELIAYLQTRTMPIMALSDNHL